MDDSQRTVLKESCFLSNLTNVVGSTMGQFAMESRLRNDWMVRFMRYIDVIEDDEYNVHNLIKKRRILFIDGLAIELEIFFELLWEIDMGNPKRFGDIRTYDFVERGSNFDRLLRFCIERSMIEEVIQDVSARSMGQNLITWGVKLPHNFDRMGWYTEMQKLVFQEMPLIENVFRKSY